MLGLTKSTVTRKYLGVPSMVGCSKKVANLRKGAHFTNYLRDGVCSKKNNGGGLFCGGNRHCHWRHGWTRHCQWRQSWREGCIVTTSGNIGHVGWREEGVANGNGDTPRYGHVGLAHGAGETAIHVKFSFSGLQASALHCLGMQQHCLGMQSRIWPLYTLFFYKITWT